MKKPGEKRLKHNGNHTVITTCIENGLVHADIHYHYDNPYFFRCTLEMPEVGYSIGKAINYLDAEFAKNKKFLTASRSEYLRSGHFGIASGAVYFPKEQKAQS